MQVELTDYQLYLLKKSLEHSIRNGQFEYTRHETEETRKVLEIIRNQHKKGKGVSG